MASMTATTDSTNTCPAWCREHQDDGDGQTFHESERQVVDVHPGSDGPTVSFTTLLSSTYPDGGLVELHCTESQVQPGSAGLLALMTADEASQLAMALLAAAAKAQTR
jgi:hypothetical protein